MPSEPMKEVGIEISPMKAIAKGVEIVTGRHRIIPRSNEQTNQSTIGYTRHATTSREHVTERRLDIKNNAALVNRLGGSNAFCAQLSVTNTE